MGGILCVEGVRLNCRRPCGISAGRQEDLMAEKFWPMVVVLMMFGWWARATYGVGLTGIIMGVWLMMGTVVAATWIVNR